MAATRKSKGVGAHDSIIRAGDRLAKLLETRAEGFKASWPILRAIGNWRTTTERHRGKGQP